MKRKTKVSLVCATVVLISPVIFSPIFMHKKNQPIEPSTVVAEDISPTSIPKNKVNPSTVADPYSQNESRKLVADNRTFKPKPQPKIKNTVNDNFYLYPEKIAKVKKETPNNPNIIKVNEKTDDQKTNPAIGVVNDSDKKPFDSSIPSESSKWGVAVIANEENADIAITYRVIQLPLFHESDIDILLGAKEAGLGISKSLNLKWGIGLTGTVSYDDSEKRLGVYAKYRF
jgi:hypothetical protein